MITGGLAASLAAEATPADAQPNLGHFEGSAGRVRWVHAESDGPSQSVVATTPEEPRAAASPAAAASPVAAASPAAAASSSTAVGRSPLLRSM